MAPAQWTRRQFLKGVAAAAAGAGVPTIIPAGARGADGRAAPSNRVAIGFVGMGNMGSSHFRNLLTNAQVQMVAACDVKSWIRDTARNRAAERGIADLPVYNDFREMYARDDIDAVFLATPEHWHAIMTIQAAKAGKDIYCEKPLSHTVREADAMVAAVRRYGRVFQTGSQQRSNFRFRVACELVRNGYIGQVHTVHVGVGETSHEAFLPEEPVPEGLDWDLWQGPAPWRPYNAERVSGQYRGGGWRMIRDYSGGMMCDWGAHHFDIAQWGLGYDGSGPVEIHPPGRVHRTLTYRYPNGVLMHRGGADGILFVGTEGRIEVNRGFIRSWPEHIKDIRLKGGDLRLYRNSDHVGNWLECIRTRRRPICDVEIGASSVTVCHLGNIAEWLDRSLRWDGQKREIIGDAEAARWLDRPCRAPWSL